jgi:hypothetical protein
MAKVYRSAMGKQIDVDHLALKNEHVIAVGNMRVNARGDELGPGGKIVKTKDQLMKEYYTLNTPVATDPMDHVQNTAPVKPAVSKAQQRAQADSEPIVEEVVFNPDSGLDEVDDGPVALPIEQALVDEVLTANVATTPALRGTLASAVAKPATVTQAELPSAAARKKLAGIQRF